MNRIRILLAVVAAVLVLGVAPALAQEEMTGDDAPAVVLDAEPAALEEEAWTFRFLVPTLMLATGVIVVGIAVGYGVRVRGRYRVVQ